MLLYDSKNQSPAKKLVKQKQLISKNEIFTALAGYKCYDMQHSDNSHAVLKIPGTIQIITHIYRNTSRH